MFPCMRFCAPLVASAFLISPLLQSTAVAGSRSTTFGILGGIAVGAIIANQAAQAQKAQQQRPKKTTQVKSKAKTQRPATAATRPQNEAATTSSQSREGITPSLPVSTRSNEVAAQGPR